jgi:uncharacterized protein Yka (UPF0111/DUF47 family)
MSLKKFGLWKDLTFYFVLEAQADAVDRASQLLSKLIDTPAQAEAQLAGLVELRAETDQLLHQFAGRLDSAFITPLDKEDLDCFSHTLEEVQSAIEAAAFHGQLAREHLDSHEKELAKLAATAGAHLHELAGLVRTSMKKQTLDSCLMALHALERKGDTLYRAALTDLVTRGVDPKILFLKKEACQHLDFTLDKSGAVATLGRRLAIKYG